MISSETISEILESVNIVDVVSYYVNLKRKGRNYFGLCPFHSEKTPSFSVSEEKGIFKCFGCGKSGNVITFLQEIERLSFYEAVKELALKYSIKIKYTDYGFVEHHTEKTEIYGVNQVIASLCSEYLLKKEEGKNALNYLQRERGLELEYITTFGIGYCPEDIRELVRRVVSHGFAETLLEKSGFMIKRADGSIHSYFAGRILFPLYDVNNRICGFAGRILDNPSGGAPKFINSPETAAYKKSEFLYGLNLARRHISELSFAILVEGYLDCIILHQYGIKNTVALCGTALTLQHALKLRRLCDTVYLLYDSDEAGVKSVFRSIPVLLQGGMEVKVITLPEKEDPDTFVIKNGASALINMLSQQYLDIIDFAIKMVYRKATSKAAKDELLMEIIRWLLYVVNPEERDRMVSKLAGLISASKEDIKALVSKVRKLEANKNYGKTAGVTTISPLLSHKPTYEMELLKYLIKYGGITINGKTLMELVMEDLIRESEDAPDFLLLANKEITDILLYFVEIYKNGQKIPPPVFTLFSIFTSAGHHDILNEITANDIFNETSDFQQTPSPEKIKKEITEILTGFKLQYIDRHIDNLYKQIKTTPDEDQKYSILQQINNLNKIRKRLAKHHPLIRTIYKPGD